VTIYIKVAWKRPLVICPTLVPQEVGRDMKRYRIDATLDLKVKRRNRSDLRLTLLDLLSFRIPDLTTDD
jgi:hypothetical protein